VIAASAQFFILVRDDRIYPVPQAHAGPYPTTLLAFQQVGVQHTHIIKLCRQKRQKSERRGYEASSSHVASVSISLALDDADRKSGFGEGVLHHALARISGFDDDDQVYKGVASRSVANALLECVEAEAVMRGCGRLDENTAAEVGKHDLGASLGAIDAERAEVHGADGLDSW
jgi:hypothetical protein